MGLTKQQQNINFLLTGSSCSVAQFVVHPIETAMVRQQLGLGTGTFLGTLSSIGRDEGVGGMYRGFTAAFIREMSYSTIRFGLYEPLRDLMHDNPKDNAALLGDDWAGAVRVLKRMFSGCTAGGIASAIATPTDVLKTRAQSDLVRPIPGFVHYVKQIAGQPNGPILSFYEGISAVITRAVVLGATKMTVYNEVKDALKRSPEASSASLQPAHWQTLVPGSYGWKDGDFDKYGHESGPSTSARLCLVFNTSVLTGLAVTMTTSAFTNARTHIMSNPGKYSGMFHCLVDIVRMHGPLGLYRGFFAQWARFGPYATVQFLVWEQLRFLCGLPGI